MYRTNRLLPGLLVMVAAHLFGQPYDLLLKGGRVIDPRNNIDAKLDVAVTGGKISRIAQGIPSEQARKIIDVSGLLVVPGLIDIHTHVFTGGKPDVFADGTYSVSADDFCPRSGVTTVVDAGTSGWRNFELFKYNIIDRSQTRILAFLNIAGSGMSGNPDQQRLDDMDAAHTAEMIRKYPGTLVGIKLGHYELPDRTPLNRTFESASMAETRVFVECHLPRYPLAEQLERMRPGDIITHTFEKITEREPIADSLGNLRPDVLAAAQRGIRFDLGHGGYGFWFELAKAGARHNWWPYTFGTDLHRFSMNAGMKSMPMVMSKFLALGMPISEVIRRATSNPALAIGRDDLGTLSAGAEADIAVLRLQRGRFGFTDSGGFRMKGNTRFEADMTLRNGKVIWDLNGRSADKTIP